MRTRHFWSCGFDKLELHPGNIGYVKLNWFADPEKCGQVTDAVTERLNATNAIVFDFRDNHGGFPETVRSIADVIDSIIRFRGTTLAQHHRKDP